MMVQSGIHLGTVIDNIRICSQHHLLTFLAPDLSEARPGQFVHLGLPIAEGDFGSDSPIDATADIMTCGQGCSAPFLRRAFSIGRLTRSSSGVTVSVLFRVVGTGTRWLSTLKQGDRLSVMGPLGRPFESANDSSRVILVAGGVGLPPLAWYGQKICEAGGRVIGILGARSAEFNAVYEGTTVYRDEDLRAVSKCHQSAVLPTWWLATDDGSAGHHGTSLSALKQLLMNEDQGFSAWTVFTCGPDRMMHAVAEFCLSRQMRCFVCLEREMACGTGTCQSCAVPVNDSAAPDGWRYKLCCTDGPVFSADEVRW